jgi:predicted permease
MDAVSLGYRLAEVRSLQWGHALGGALLRIVGGFAAASAAVLVIGAHGINRQVLLLYGALPAAVVNFILTEKYRQDPALAASSSSALFYLSLPYLWFCG